VWRESLRDELLAIAQHVEKSVPARRALMDVHAALGEVDSLRNENTKMREALICVLSGWEAKKYQLDFVATDKIRTALGE